MGVLIVGFPHSVGQLPFIMLPVNTCVLLNRAAEARALGEQMAAARNRISKLSQHHEAPGGHMTVQSCENVPCVIFIIIDIVKGSTDHGANF